MEPIGQALENNVNGSILSSSLDYFSNVALKVRSYFARRGLFCEMIWQVVRAVSFIAPSENLKMRRCRTLDLPSKLLGAPRGYIHLISNIRFM